MPARFLPYTRRIDPRGILGVLQAPDEIPFAPVRLFYLSGTPKGVARGGHAHKECHQLLVTPVGEVVFRAVAADGNTLSGSLNAGSDALYLPPLTWLDLEDFAGGTVVLVLASHPYNEADYIRNAETFAALIKRVVEHA